MLRRTGWRKLHCSGGRGSRNFSHFPLGSLSGAGKRRCGQHFCRPKTGPGTFGLVLPRGEFLDTSLPASETQPTYILIRVMGIGRGNAPGPG
jgi:hypothetical protein